MENLMNKKKSHIEIIQTGLKRSFFQDLYYLTIKSSWIKFFLISAACYILLNLIFGLIYLYSPATILNASPDSLWDAFVFSFQTSSTLGYGRLVPNSNLTHGIVLLDTLMGIFYVAIVTGLAFSKFSRPSAKVLFSDKTILTTFDDIPTLMFRLGNGRSTQIVDASLNVAALIPYTSTEGIKMSRFHKLKLLSNNNPTFSLSWTAMHLIDETSPLFELNLEEIQKQGIIIFVTFTGIDDILSQTVHTKYRYSTESIIEARKFVDILKKEGTSFTIDFEKFHEVEI
jgi:inward rectifier potassium channel